MCDFLFPDDSPFRARHRGAYAHFWSVRSLSGLAHDASLPPNAGKGIVCRGANNLFSIATVNRPQITNGRREFQTRETFEVLAWFTALSRIGDTGR